MCCIDCKNYEPDASDEVGNWISAVVGIAATAVMLWMTWWTVTIERPIGTVLAVLFSVMFASGALTAAADALECRERRSTKPKHGKFTS